MMHPNQAAASLGLATRLQDEHLIPNEQPQAQPQPPQTPQNAPEQEQTSSQPDNPKEEKKEDVGAKITEMELSFTKQLDQIRKEMKDDQQKELEAIKNEITAALAEEDHNESPKVS